MDSAFNFDSLKIDLKKSEKRKNFSIQMEILDSDRIMNLRLYKIKNLKERDFINTTFFEEGIELLMEKFDIPLDEEYPKIKLGRDGSKREIKATSVLLYSKTINYINDFIGYQNFVIGDIRYSKKNIVKDILALFEKKYNRKF